MRPSNVVVLIAAHLTTFITTAALPGTAHAGWVPVLSGSTERVVASDAYVSVLRHGEAWILREDGHPLHRLARPDVDKDVDRAPATGATKREAEQILDFLDVPEADRGTDYAEEILDGESTLAQRRLKRSQPVRAEAAPNSSLMLAATATDIWISGNRGAFRFDSDGRLLRAFGREAWGSALAAAAQWLLVDHGNTLDLLSTVNGTRRSTELSSVAKDIAISLSGQRVAWTTSASVGWVDANGEAHSLDSATAIDVVYCGETLVVMMAEGLLVLSPDGHAEMRANSHRARKLVCPAAARAPWISLGQGMFASADEGRHWESIALPAGTIPLDVAVSAHHVWLATSDGLYSSSDGETRTHTTPVRSTHTPRSRAERKPSLWTSWMPKVAVQGQAAFAPDGHQWQALAFASFPLDVKPQLTIPISATTVLDDGVPESPPTAPRPAEPTVDLRDSDRACLTDARRKAVELAMAEPERALSYVVRAGRAAWLPELRVLVARRYGRSESLDLNSSSTALASPVGIDTVNDIRYEARATWDLARLVFSSEELAAQTQALHMAELRRDIETTMNRLYFERRRTMVDMVSDRKTDRDGQLHRQLRVGEIEAELDAMSSGAFSTCTAGKSTGVR